MTPRPTPAVYRRRRLAVALGALVVIALVVWLISAAVGALGSSHDKAADQAAASAYASAEASTAPTVSVPVVPINGKCDAGDIVVKPVTTAGHATEPVKLTFQVFTQKNPQCVWKATHGSVEISIKKHGAPFWSTVDCPAAVLEQSVTLRQGTPITLTLVTWDSHSSSRAGGCGSQASWSVPGAYIVYAAAKGGNPSFAALNLFAPGAPLPVVTPSATATATGSAAAKPSATSAPKTTAATTPSATPTTW